VAKLTTLKILFVVVAKQNWFFRQLDVDNVFLHGDFKEEVGTTTPPRIITCKDNQVYRLRKLLYGLKKAS